MKFETFPWNRSVFVLHGFKGVAAYVGSTPKTISRKFNDGSIKPWKVLSQKNIIFRSDWVDRDLKGVR